jgi:nucleoside-diphosphate-sugar epimerase
MSRIVLTGANGFIGRHLVDRLALEPFAELLLVVRQSIRYPLPKNVRVAVLADFRHENAWLELLQPGDKLIHLAGLAHRDLPTDTQVEGFYEANVATTRAIARAATVRQISLFIFISSIGVYGSSRDDVVNPCSVLHPDQPYAESKLAAELALLSAPGRGYPCIILRLPLVYGPDAPGNFGKLLRLISLGLPLPFAALKNRKSFLAVSTLNEIICRLLQRHWQQDYTLIAAEPEAITLAELLRQLSAGVGSRSPLFYVPQWLLKLLFQLSGQKKNYRKLCLALEADSSDLFRLLDWTPELNSRDLVRQIGEQYRERPHR